MGAWVASTASQLYCIRSSHQGRQLVEDLGCGSTAFLPHFFTRRGPASSGWNYLAFPNDAAPEHSAAMSSSRRHATRITCIFLWICMKVTNDFEIEVEKRFSKGGGGGSRMVSG